jgi:uncharacterized protein
LTLGTASGAVADSTAEPANDLPLVVDEAGLLTGTAAAALERDLAAIARQHGSDVVVVTVPSLDGRTATGFADDYFDYGPDPADPALPGRDPEAGYGRGADRSGILLLVSMEERDWALSTRGSAIDVFSDATLAGLADEFLPELSAGDWAGAVGDFAAEVGRVWRDATRLRWEIVVAVAVAAGLLGGLVPVTIWRRQLKSVRPAPHARAYLEAASLTLTRSQDSFLGHSTRVIDLSPPSGGPGGGSSTHFGSSGISHGGMSGKF